MITRKPEGTKDEVRDFWNRNVCQADLPKGEPGTKEFFDEVEAIRYRHHYHLPPLFTRIRAIAAWMRRPRL